MSHREKQLKKSAVRVVESDLGVIDLPYLLLTLLLVAIGLLVLFSASYARAYYETKNAASVFVNQLIFAVMGIGVMWLISRVPYEWYQKLSLLILAASIGLLVLVPFIGTESGGATRWLDFGFVSFQPSEIAKFGVICSFAAIMAAHTRDMKTIRYGVAPYVVILGIIAVLLYLEPHMSATLIILALGFILMTLGGTDWKYLSALLFWLPARCRLSSDEGLHRRTHQRMAAPGERPARQGPAGAAVAVCHRLRRPAGPRLRPRPPEVSLPAGGA